MSTSRSPTPPPTTVWVLDDHHRPICTPPAPSPVLRGYCCCCRRRRPTPDGEAWLSRQRSLLCGAIGLVLLVLCSANASSAGYTVPPDDGGMLHRQQDGGIPGVPGNAGVNPDGLGPGSGSAIEWLGTALGSGSGGGAATYTRSAYATADSASGVRWQPVGASQEDGGHAQGVIDGAEHGPGGHRLDPEPRARARLRARLHRAEGGHTDGG